MMAMLDTVMSMVAVGLVIGMIVMVVVFVVAEGYWGPTVPLAW